MSKHLYAATFMARGLIYLRGGNGKMEKNTDSIYKSQGQVGHCTLLRYSDHKARSARLLYTFEGQGGSESLLRT